MPVESSAVVLLHVPLQKSGKSFELMDVNMAMLDENIPNMMIEQQLQV